MTPILQGIYLGRALAEGDYLGAATFLPDLLKAVKTAAPSLLKNVAASKISAVEQKFGLAPAAPAAPVIDTTAVPMDAAPTRPSWVLPAVAVGGLGLFLFLRRRRK